MKNKMRITAVGDLHMNEESLGKYDTFFQTIERESDILLICGDITTRGLPKEAELLALGLDKINIPKVMVLGNHDYEGDKVNDIKKILRSHTIHILDGESVVIGGVGFAGVKGFCGGFDGHMLGSLGEKAIKDFVAETVNEALKLETAIDQLDTEKKYILLHYSPIKETVATEPLEIMSFLGSSRLEDVINRKKINGVFHGHAHHGVPKGKTSKNIPVYNVAYPLLQKVSPEKPYLTIIAE